MAKRQFGVSTHLYHGQRLSRDHLLEIAAHGFETVEVFATRTHFDYHNPAAVADLQQWLAEAGLTLHAIHAPVMQAYEGGRWKGPLSLASADADARAQAIAETERALYVARRIPVRVLVAHLGLPRTGAQGSRPDSRAAARRSIEELQRVAGPLGVQIAVEVIPNELSRAGSLVHFVEDDLEGLEGGRSASASTSVMRTWTATWSTPSRPCRSTSSRRTCTTTAGGPTIISCPFEGTIDWPAALTAVQKVGYEGPLMLEIAAHGSAKETLARAQKARQRMERLLAD